LAWEENGAVRGIFTKEEDEPVGERPGAATFPLRRSSNRRPCSRAPFRDRGMRDFTGELKEDVVMVQAFIQNPADAIRPKK
jgi:hypothetical protein